MNERLIKLARAAYDDAAGVRDQLVQRWSEAWRYYQADPSIVPAPAGRSKAVVPVLEQIARKTLRNVRRVFLGQDEVVEYLPRRPELVRAARELTDYVNYVVLPANRIDRELVKALLRVLVAGIAPVEVRSREVKQERVLRYDIPESDDELAALAQGGALIAGGQELEVRQVERRREVIVEPFPLDELLIDPEATCVDDAILVGRQQQLRVGQIAEMGYDSKRVRELMLQRPASIDEDDERERITFIDLYLRVDTDGDGLEEIHHLVFIDDVGEEQLLEHERVDAVPYALITGLERPDQLVGEALYDQVAPYQRIMTALLRQALDNTYWSNFPRPIVNLSVLENPEDLEKHDFGRPLYLKSGARPQDAVMFHEVPYVAGKTWEIMQWFDAQLQQVTGVNDAAGGLDPEALQNLTATAAQLIEQSGIGGVDEWVRALEPGISDVFRLLLREVLRNPPSDAVRIRDQFVRLNVDVWSEDMDVRLNTGLGAGSRTRDLQAIQFVLGLQRQIIEGFGAINPFVKAEHVYNAVKRAIEAAGLKSPDLYIAEPDPAEVQALTAKAGTDARLELERQKIAAQLQLEKAKMERELARERAQMEADLKVRQQEADNALLKAEMEAEVRKEVERAKLDMERRLKEMELENQIVIEEMRAQTQKELERMRLEAKEMELIRDEADRDAACTARNGGNGARSPQGSGESAD